MRRRLLLLLLPLWACGTDEAFVRPAGPRVDEVRIVGNERLSDGRIQSHLATRGSGRFLFFGEDHFLDTGAVAQDERRIRDIYEEEGHWASNVRSQIVPRDDGSVEVRFIVREGPPARLRSLLVSGLSELPPEELAYVLDDLPLREGDVFREEDWEASKEQLQQRLLNLGYAAAEVESLAEVSPREGDADAILAARPGALYEFGDLQVEGNLLVRERRIREMAGLVIQPGDRFSPEALSDAQRIVFNLGVFSVATVTPGELDAERQRVPVRIGVGEADFLRLRLGVGAGIDQDFYQVRALADFTHLNVFGGLQRLDFNNELAYRFVSPTSQSTGESGPAGSSSVELTQPAVLGPRVDLAARVRYLRELTPAYSAQSLALRLGAPILIRRWFYFVPSYNVVNYFGVDVFDLGDLAPGVRPSLVGDCPEGCTLSFLEQRLSVDRRDSSIEPRVGWYASLGLQEGGGFLGGSFSWIRLLPEARGYLPLASDLVLAGRLQLGWLWPLGECDDLGDPYLRDVGCSPIVVRFFGGGSTGFRGVPTDQLSPLRTVIQDGERRYVPLGGNSSLLATTELRWHFADEWASAFFLDAGSVAASSGAALRFEDLQWALGTGLRYLTPVGAARIDVAYRFLRDPRVVVDGGPPPEETTLDYFAVFLSLGEAF